MDWGGLFEGIGDFAKDATGAYANFAKAKAAERSGNVSGGGGGSGGYIPQAGEYVAPGDQPVFNIGFNVPEYPGQLGGHAKINGQWHSYIDEALLFVGVVAFLSVLRR